MDHFQQHFHLLAPRCMFLLVYGKDQHFRPLDSLALRLSVSSESTPSFSEELGMPIDIGTICTGRGSRPKFIASFSSLYR